MPRPLTDVELGCAKALVRYGCGGPCPPSFSQRLRWLTFLDTATACDACGCGSCPSIKLGDAEGHVSDGASSHVLVGGDGRLLVLLHIIGDRPAYLEGAPVDDAGVTSFPEPDQLTFTD